MMFNLNVRFKTDSSIYAIWQVWGDGGEVRVSLTTGKCFPHPWPEAEIGTVIAHVYEKMGSQIDFVSVTPAVGE